MNKIINIEMTQKQHLILGIKIAIFMSIALFLKMYLATPYEPLNKALIALFGILTFISSIQWITAEIHDSI